MELTHIDDHGRARMVDISDKQTTRREAVAEGYVSAQPETLKLIQEGGIPKGDVFATARLAGIMAAKKTDDLIPLCHSLPLDSISVELAVDEKESKVKIKATALCSYKTGVEMEALTAVSMAALTIYDMCKAVDRGMEIGGIHLLKKSGGRSGTFERKEE